MIEQPLMTAAQVQKAINILCKVDAVFQLKTLSDDQKLAQFLIHKTWEIMEDEKKKMVTK